VVPGSTFLTPIRHHITQECRAACGCPDEHRRTLEVHKTGAIYAATGMLSATEANRVTWNTPASIYPIGFQPALGTSGNYAIAVWYDNSSNLMYSVAWVP
jgi:hypothetical protein